jgi:c(7)-type cytochrome triheme protein
MLQGEIRSRMPWVFSLLRKQPLAFAAVGVLALSASVRAVPAQVRVPILKQHAKIDPSRAGVFSHWRHEQYQCVACHPTIFPCARKGFTHDETDEGKFCGACDDGRTAPFASGARANCKI